MTSEEAVHWYRPQSGNEASVRANHFDQPVVVAAKRFAESEEFAEMRRLLGAGQGLSLPDLGAGNGIASYALAIDGWRVTALEPDPSDGIGSRAIRTLSRDTDVSIAIEDKTVNTCLSKTLHSTPSLRVKCFITCPTSCRRCTNSGES